MFASRLSQPTFLNGRLCSKERNCQSTHPRCNQRIPESSVTIHESIVWVVVKVVATRK